MQQEASYKWPMILFTIGVFMAGLDNGIISAALTTVYQSFEVSPTWGAWTITLYTLGIAISVPIIGKLSDRYGRKRLFLVEVFLFGLGSLLVALSPNFTFLLVARFIQALGGGGIFIIGSSFVLATVPKKNQGKFLGLLGSMHGLSAVIGPNVGALILHLTGAWEWMFLINVPIALFLFVMGILKIEESKSPSTASLDIIGAVYLTVAILLLMLGLTNIEGQALVQSIASVSVLPYMLGAVLLVYLFLNYEKRLEASGGDPVISYHILRNKPFLLIMFLGVLSGGFLATIVFIPSYVQQVLQVPAASAGFWVTPVAIASGIGSGLGGFLTDKIGPKKTIMMSGVIGFTGFLLFHSFVDNMFLFIIASMLGGIGLGFLLGAPINMLMSQYVAKEQYGTSLGTLSLMRQLGMTLFPTIYAGFVATSVVQVGPEVQEAATNHDLAFPLIEGEEAYGAVMDEINQVGDPFLQEQLTSLVANVMKTGFQQMFLVAIIISIFVFGISTYFNALKGNRNL